MSSEDRLLDLVDRQGKGLCSVLGQHFKHVRLLFLLGHCKDPGG
jgi:hypothetical protein